MRPRDVTLGDLIGKYLEEVSIRCLTVRSILERAQRDPISRVKLKDFNRQHVDAWIAKRLESATPGSVSAYSVQLSKVLRWGRVIKQLDVADGLFRDGIQRMRQNGLDLSVGQRSRVASDAELASLYAWWRANPVDGMDMIAIVEVAIETACRVNEICGVEAKDYSPEARTLWRARIPWTT